MTNLVKQILLERYRVDEFIGQGGMAEVYKAWDSRRNHDVALKVLKRDMLQDPRSSQGFKDEAKVLHKLPHPNIVRYYDFEKDDNLAFLVIEYVDGESLHRKLAGLNRPMSLKQALGILKPLCLALHFAHEEGVIHCDVKPANILINKAGKVLLSDFGIARWTQQINPLWLGAGAPGYMAPEQCGGNPIDRWTDIYALGLTAYELLTLDRPFRGNSTANFSTAAERVRWEHLHQKPPLPSRKNPDISPQTERAILRALAKDSSERPATAIAFLNEISNHGEIEPDITTHWPEQSVNPPPSPPRQSILSRHTPVSTGAARESVWQRWGFKPPARQQFTSQARLEILQGESPGQVYYLGVTDVHIGRAVGNQIRLYDRSVSRHHASIRYANDRFYLQDKGSTHGTYVNNRQVDATVLNDGDQIQIGETEILFLSST